MLLGDLMVDKKIPFLIEDKNDNAKIYKPGDVEERPRLGLRRKSGKKSQESYNKKILPIKNGDEYLSVVYLWNDENMRVILPKNELNQIKEKRLFNFTFSELLNDVTQYSESIVTGKRPTLEIYTPNENLEKKFKKKIKKLNRKFDRKVNLKKLGRTLNIFKRKYDNDSRTEILKQDYQDHIPDVGFDEFKKSVYHRKYSRIDNAVAAAARIMSPDINILAAFDLGTGVGPHFVYPVKNFNRMIISRDMIRGDNVASEILGYPFKLVKYAMINTGGKDVKYTLHPNSDLPDKDMLKKIHENAFDRGGVNFWKPTLYLQYFLPHYFQVWLFQRMESIFTWINREFYKNI